MEHRLELAAKALAIERVASGGLAAIAPGRAIGAIATPKSDTEAARYVARLLGIRQVVLGVMLWQSREDRAWLRRMATLNALTEALDAAATLVALVQRRGGELSSAARGETNPRKAGLALGALSARRGTYTDRIENAHLGASHSGQRRAWPFGR